MVMMMRMYNDFVFESTVTPVTNPQPDETSGAQVKPTTPTPNPTPTGENLDKFLSDLRDQSHKRIEGWKEKVENEGNLDDYVGKIFMCNVKGESTFVEVLGNYKYNVPVTTTGGKADVETPTLLVRDIRPDGKTFPIYPGKLKPFKVDAEVGKVHLCYKFSKGKVTLDGKFDETRKGELIKKSDGTPARIKIHEVRGSMFKGRSNASYSVRGLLPVNIRYGTRKVQSQTEIDDSGEPMEVEKTGFYKI